MNIEFRRLPEIEKLEIIELMNNDLVRRQMPLLIGTFTEKFCEQFVRAKESLWENHGYGPWAFVVDGSFAGWGGLQPENGEADLALVLHPNYWGIGKNLYKKIINRAFGEMMLKSITILFPPSRTRINGILRLGFKKDSELQIDNKPFTKYRLNNPKLQ